MHGQCSPQTYAWNDDRIRPTKQAPERQSYEVVRNKSFSQNNVMCLSNGIYFLMKLQAGTKINGMHAFLKDFVSPSPLKTMMTNKFFNSTTLCRGKGGDIHKWFNSFVPDCSKKVIFLSEIFLV